jgi:hypothetical protein
MVLTWIFAALFAAGGILCLAQDPPALLPAGLALVAAFALAGVAVQARKQADEAKRFLAWLVAHRDEVLAGGADFDGHLIRVQTGIVRYMTVVSFLYVTVRTPTRIYFADDEPTGAGRGTATLLTLLLGWWGLPWGPIYTCKALYGNLRGGERNTVGALLGVTVPME